MVELNFETIGVNINNSKAEEVATPKSICNDMADLFDYADCNKKIWADFYCKTGNTLEALINHGVSVNNIMAICGNQQSQMLVCRKIYHKLLPVVEVDTSNIRGLEEYIITRMGQVYYVDTTKTLEEYTKNKNKKKEPFRWQDAVKYNEAYRVIKEVILKEMEKTMSLEWAPTDDFAINNVIMNPPYNKGIDIDFDFLAFEVANDSIVCIQPAKCFSAETDQKIQSTYTYNDFQKDIVSHVSNICYYPDCLDVFGIAQADGIVYFKIDKYNTYENRCTVINKCNLQSYINSKEIRDITHKQTLWNICSEIINYLGNYTVYKFSEAQLRKEYTLNINTQLMQSLTASGAWDFGTGCIKQSYVGHGGFLFNQNGQILVLSKSRLLQGNSKSSSDASKDMFTSDSIDECKSFYSWIYSKLTRFFLLTNVSMTRVLNPNTFRFCPAPPTNPDGTYKWDHIYTDEELYKLYGLDKEDAKTADGVRYTDIIEAVIKERE